MDTEYTYQPFQSFSQQTIHYSPLRQAIIANWRRAETEVLPALCEQLHLSATQSTAIYELAYHLADGVRQQKPQHNLQGVVQGLLQEYSLSSQEGIALMCLAEALLRIPDNATRELLIRDKISQGEWRTHLGKSSSLFVNAASWGLLLTGKLTTLESDVELSSRLNKIVLAAGEPLVRKGVEVAIGLLGSQFVAGENIGLALKNVKKYEAKGFCYSYDMLGEAALTETDARYYLAAYQQAIQTIGTASKKQDLYRRPGISIKLSALHSRYCRAQYHRVMQELYPRLLSLAKMAHQYQVGLNIDAEESERLDLSLDLLQKLCFEPELAGWDGIGFVVQAYQKRALPVLEYLVDLAKQSQHRLMIRLVKGAYWDSEIKRAQIEGQAGYPVYTRKVYTDVSYLVCAQRLLAEPEAIYPQFATHNAHSVASIYHLAGPERYWSGQYEFQCLHGMGEALYEQVVGLGVDPETLNRPCRIYAPVGSYQNLLAYLVRRLLENGANSSFVNQIADERIPLDTLLANPLQQVQALAEKEGQMGLPHPQLPLPRDLYGPRRLNSGTLDLNNESDLIGLAQQLADSARINWQAAPVIAGEVRKTANHSILYNPADKSDRVGSVYSAGPLELEQALSNAVTGFAEWQAVAPAERARLLRKGADNMEQQMPWLMCLAVREAGKTWNNALSEVREAIDFLRYYAMQVEQQFANSTHIALGPVVCISPWNFPLAIFCGQIGAALAAGNSVLAKPAEQTPLIAAEAVRLLLEAGIPPAALQFLPGDGESVGAPLVEDNRIEGVLFTGSEAVAKLLQRTLSQRLGRHGQPVPLIAETGGINAMIVDSSALTEQVVADIMTSAFDSAGQRCSALRLLCVQEEAADRTLRMLKGAMKEFSLGNPVDLCTDIGPIIDVEAKTRIEQHIAQMTLHGRDIKQHARLEQGVDLSVGHYVTPALIELQEVDDLRQEVFGPVLHVVRYSSQTLDKIIQQINGRGYGLTLGVHSRIERRVQRVIDEAHVGNIYVNRNMVGAVVGVQPFGGEGLSGTGPKAGGPLYLYRLLSRYPAVNILPEIPYQQAELKHVAVSQAFTLWLEQEGELQLMQQSQDFVNRSLAGRCYELTGPTGELNCYLLKPRRNVLAIADNKQDLLLQLAALLATGCQVLWQELPLQRELWHKLPLQVQQQINFTSEGVDTLIEYDALLVHWDETCLLNVARQVAERPGAVIPIQGYVRGCRHLFIERLLQEQSISINSAAAGGNTHLMTMQQ